MTENLKGATFMILCMLAYSINDALIKFAGLSLPIFESIFIRGIFTIILLFLIAIIRKELFIKINNSDFRLMTIRVIGDVGTTICFIFAIFNMKLANATAILLTLPLLITIASSIIYKEKVGLIRWIIILIGFFGALLIIKPASEGFNYYSILAILAVIFIMLRDLTTHKISNKLPSIYISIFTACAVTFSALILIPTHGWVMPTKDSVLVLFLASLFLSFGIILSVTAIRSGEINFSSPFRYSIIIFAIIIGFLMFEEKPDVLSFLGCSIIIITGIYLLKKNKNILPKDPG